jgi:hypothetical protein
MLHISDYFNNLCDSLGDLLDFLILVNLGLLYRSINHFLLNVNFVRDFIDDAEALTEVEEPIL